MLVLLPPSEGKAASGEGGPLDPAGLALPALNPARERVLDALTALCAEGDGAEAMRVLGLSEGLRGELARNAGLRTAPALPAGRLYTGVLYDALDLAALAPAARAAAERSLLVFSGLWGALRITDRVPPYRCSMGVKLPPLGALGPYWRAAMAEVLPEAAGEGLVLDLRSSAYAAAWRPTGAVASRTATVRVLHEREVAGVVKRSVVSHFNKATKGRLLRDLLQAGAEPRDPGELAVALRDLTYTVEQQPAAAGKPVPLDVVVTEL
ncbi:peroxide stress protein YaaA [Peterkaempfera bronchialis]|uniref:Peroxide stress protein YaaA n=1 Tax=Peterkaempfera bronchialis TaxID=2126346 RepID=A0A345SUB5_9ACTN|nr:peroxide stress protein YaaA [Peterkaempfera bronchialis]AXI77320.1 peroxide stress protein YaaA [Peterkaempfera bronchialis]